ncbi:LytR family transcriptional attenuator [Cytobacillus oceanisediminis]|uniref:LytR family transcriptional attenuator n=1 Tax=Cytobacillus oceanisediminis TaxID=665099 RepID=A0A2V3A368_9BACI|nr:LCP family protein [Cytobacillus oceanisediminis]PWW31256.1 LytR family transcriptional attenuator [Cytobacillus oceanisediminis]
MTNRSREDFSLNKRRKLRKRRVALVILVPLMILFAFTAFLGTHFYGEFKRTANASFEEIEGREKSPHREEAVKIDKDNFSMLIIGVDDSEKRGFGENSRSDALLLLTVNQKDHTAKLLSIPRDSYVFIPQEGYETRINHAHAFGGPKATIETVENLLEIPVDYYARINFQAFMEVIDALGGIDVDVPFAFSEQDSEDRAGAISLEPGLQTLNGEEALALARTRKIDNDIERGKRQQEIIKAVIRKAASVDSFSKYDDVFDAIGSNMKTNLTFGEMKYLAQFAIKDPLTIESKTLEGQDSTLGGAYYYQLDQEALELLKTDLQSHLELHDGPIEQ